MASGSGPVLAAGRRFSCPKRHAINSGVWGGAPVQPVARVFSGRFASAKAKKGPENGAFCVDTDASRERGEEDRPEEARPFAPLPQGRGVKKTDKVEADES